MRTEDATPSLPWWRYPLVWMVIGGPATVVVAGFATLYIAVSAPDPVIREMPTRSASESDKRLLPAMAGRNHAVTPGRDVPGPAGPKP